MFSLEQIADCTRCSLRESCNQVVTGIGSVTARLFIVGDNANSEDDLMGEPFSGLPGQLLRKLMSKAGVKYEDCYITYTVKCKSTLPSTENIAACKSWLWKEIQLIKPKVVITMGLLPAYILLRKKKSMHLKDVVGQTFPVEYMDSIIMPWYHPSYLLNTGAAMELKTVEFFKRVKEQI